MSETQSRAAKEAWARRREQAKMTANERAGAEADAAAAAIPDDSPVDPGTEQRSQDEGPRQPTRSANDWRLEALEQMRGRPEDDDEIERQLSDFTEEAPVEGAEQPGTQATEQTPAPGTPEQGAHPQAAAPTVKVHVNGQEVEVPQSEIDEYGGVRAYQRQKGLEHQIEVAKENNKKTYEMMRQMARIMQAQAPVAQPQAQKTLLDLAKEKAPLFQFGTPEEAAGALTELIETASPKIDQNQLIARAVQEFSRRQAMEEFVAQNQDIAKNQYLAVLAIQMENARLSQSQPSDWRKFYANLATELRNGVGLPNPTSPAATTQPVNPNPTGSMADKDARKASIVALPVAGSRMPAKEEAKPLTREDRLNLLRKARGQPM